MDAEAPDISAVPGCGPRVGTQDGQTLSLRQQVFAHVRAVGQASRADIARGLDVSAGSVTAITADLIQLGLLTECTAPAREQGRGRPPVALSVVPGFACVVGVKIADASLSAVVTDFAGITRADISRPSARSRKTPEDLITELDQLISDLLAGAGLTMPDISGIGLGLSGIVDHETGIVPWSPLLWGVDIPLAQLARARFGVPVTLDNDANVLTLAELWFGQGRNRPDFAVVTIEHGVGMGLVLNNRLFRGSRGMGLELGHTKVALDGALCRCGQRGCLEAYLADYALAREAATALNDTDPTTDPGHLIERLYAQAQAGNVAARTIFDRAGRYLAVGLANVVQLFDPALVILAGERIRYNYLFSQDVVTDMETLTLTEGRSRCQIVTHVWDDLVWARGAAALALSALTDRLLSA
ncbi:XylR family transcriptional regulator [Loktanella sp. 3ANDIMAR09]|uniref:ROK family protein n=1 Tax=Loktanella sp. 3ANDIMAR09 TaxID=1225657 RepID=UPI0006FE8E25|nr:ROK family protein [Loktanella sp. 3ANDIMAR09]KQI68819.1 XylR family transcriptional regulator [Loktanella sp. 3ANDIMAR09]